MEPWVHQVKQVMSHKVFATNSDFRTPLSFATLCRRPLIFQTMNYVRSNSQSLKYQRFTPSYYTDIGVRKVEFVAKSHFLWPFPSVIGLNACTVLFVPALFMQLLEWG